MTGLPSGPDRCRDYRISPHGPPRGSGIGPPNGRLQPVGFVPEDLAGTIVQVGFIEI
jgi:hypothetical protein